MLGHLHIDANDVAFTVSVSSFPDQLWNLFMEEELEIVDNDLYVFDLQSCHNLSYVFLRLLEEQNTDEILRMSGLRDTLKNRSLYTALYDIISPLAPLNYQ